MTRGKPKTVYLQRKQKAQVDKYSVAHELSFSAALSELVERGFQEWKSNNGKRVIKELYSPGEVKQD